MTAQRPTKAKRFGLELGQRLKGHKVMPDRSCQCGEVPPNDRSWTNEDIADWHRYHKLKVAAAVSAPQLRSGK